MIAVWMGHESGVTTHQYVEADLRMKQRALQHLHPPKTTYCRYRDKDALLHFLEGLLTCSITQSTLQNECFRSLLGGIALSARTLLKWSLRGTAGIAAFGVGALALILLVMWGVNQFPTELPRPTGPFPVGRTILTWVDDNPHTQLHPTPQNVRELVAWVWYPATARSLRTADYLPRRWRDALARSGGVLMTHFLTRSLAKVRIHSIENAPLAPDERQYPVVLLLPGSGALAAGYTALAEDLASRGYIVVGLNAAHLTTVVVLADGQVIYRAAKYDLDALPESQAKLLAARLVSFWSADIGFAIDRLKRLDTYNSGSPFAGRLDLQELGIVGHSLGGAIAANFCFTDSRCKAGIDLDGRLFGPAITAGLSQPFMFIFEDLGRDSGPEAARVLAEVHSMYARLPTGSRLGISLTGANHFTFTDQMLVKDPIPLTILRHVGAIRLSGTRGLRITENYVSTFFDVYLKGQSHSELDDLERKYPEVHVW